MKMSYEESLPPTFEKIQDGVQNCPILQENVNRDFIFIQMYHILLLHPIFSHIYELRAYSSSCEKFKMAAILNFSNKMVVFSL